MRRLQQWLKDTVNDPSFREHIWWYDEKQALIAIHWKHASYDDYEEQDSALFKKWAQDNNRYDASANDSAEERKRWKTNFRCALSSATNIKKGRINPKDEKQAYRVYELLETPDPQKVVKKQKSNRKAAQSKQKPSSEKRPYNSRLNRGHLFEGEIKLESTECRGKNCSSKRRSAHSHKIVKCKEEVLSDDEMLADLLNPTPVQHCDQFHSQTSNTSFASDLPATIDMFNEEDEKDGGYCSASDSSSVNSLDSNGSRGGVSPIFQEDQSGPIRLDPVDTIFPRRNYYTVTQLPTPHYSTNTDCYECEMTEDSQFLPYNTWGMTYCEVSTMPRVHIQLQDDYSTDEPYSMQHECQDQYSGEYYLQSL